MLLHTIISLLSQPENWKALYNTELSDDDKDKLGLLVLDMSAVTIMEDGGVEGIVFCKSAEDCSGCDICKESKKPEQKEVGTMVAMVDPLHDYEDKETQTELEKAEKSFEDKGTQTEIVKLEEEGREGERKGSGDSGVVLEVQEGVIVGGLEGLQLGRKNGDGKEVESSDNDDGGVEVNDGIISRRSSDDELYEGDTEN